MHDRRPACQLKIGMSNQGCIPSGTSPRRSVGNGAKSAGTRSGRRARISLNSVVDETMKLSPPARAVFTKIVHGKPVSAIASYWQQQIFAGREVPPAEKAGDAAVLAFVKANPGAIGYISAGVTADGVKLLTIR